MKNNMYIGVVFLVGTKKYPSVPIFAVDRRRNIMPSEFHRVPIVAAVVGANPYKRRKRRTG